VIPSAADIELEGVTVANANGDVEHTVAALGSVISWTELLKNTAPEKLLRRPPVRFVFDVFQAVHRASGILSLNASVAAMSWDQVGERKQTKITFMDACVGLISRYLGTIAVAKGANIVTGTEAQETNRLLQHLALAGQLYMLHTAPRSDTSYTISRTEANGWVTEALVALSADGSDWRAKDVYALTIRTGLRDVKQTVNLALDAAVGGACSARFVRIYPLSFEGDLCMRLELEERVALQASVAAPDESKESRVSPLAKATRLLGLLEVLSESAEVCPSHWTSLREAYFRCDRCW
jgi:hypothetical protein